MGFALTEYTVPLFVAAVISAGLLAVTIPQRGRKGAWAVIGFLTAIVAWTVSYALLLGTDTPAQRLLWNNVRFLGPTLATLSIFVFALQYTGRDDVLTARNLVLLAVVPLVTNVLVWTNASHGLVRTGIRVVSPPGSAVRLDISWGPWYYVHALYSYLLATGALLLFVEKWLRLGETPAAVKRTRLLLLATVVPLVGSVVYNVGLTRIDFAPFGFTISGVLMLLAVRQYPGGSKSS